MDFFCPKVILFPPVLIITNVRFNVLSYSAEFVLMTSKYNKSQKFVLILQKLQQKNGAFAGDLKEEFDLDDRTLRRYIKDLKDLDLPIQKKRDTTSYGYKDQRIWIDANFQRSGVQITILEWISLRFGRTLFDFLEGTNFSQGIDDALESLSTIVGEKTLEITQDLNKKFMNVPEHAKDHSKTSEIIEDILDALLYQNTVDAFYARIGAPMRKYILHPYTLVTFRQGLYLFAYDVVDQRIKTFAVDRFQNFARRRKEHFKIPADYNPELIVTDAFGIIGGPVEDIVLRFSHKAAPYIQERLWHHSQELEAAERGDLILKLRVGIAHELKSWLLSFGPDVTVLAPESLAQEIKTLHRKAAGL